MVTSDESPKSSCRWSKTSTSISKTEKVKISWSKKDKALKAQSQSIETTKLRSQTPCSFPDEAAAPQSSKDRRPTEGSEPQVKVQPQQPHRQAHPCRWWQPEINRTAVLPERNAFDRSRASSLPDKPTGIDTIPGDESKGLNTCCRPSV